MGSRTVYGNSISENGWPMVDEASCQWIDVPGTEVSLQMQQGQPLQILQAFAADFNTEIEPLRDADSACWTSTNSVSSSNHLSGTACDFNWNSHPFQVADAGFDAAQLAKLRNLLAWYEDTVFWGNDWDTPKDAMHFQMGYNTYGNPHTADFINRKVRADGYSTRRGGTPIGGATSTPVSNTTPTDNAATLLYDAVPIIDEDRAAQLLGPIRAGLAAAQCTNPKRIAMALAQWGHESAGYATTEEYASGAAYEGRADLGNTQPGDGVRFKGRTWIQITGRSNYTKFSNWAASQGLISDPNYFVNNPTALGDLKWAGVGAAWYWTVARPTINNLCDQGDVVGVTQLINGGQNGIDDRRARYSQAIELGDRLLALISTTPTDNEGDDTLSALSPEDQIEVRDNLRWLRAQFDATDFGPDSSMGKTADGKELTVRDGLAEEKRTIEELKELLTAPGVAVVVLQAQAVQK